MFAALFQRSVRKPVPAPRRPVRLQVEGLEGRAAPSAFGMDGIASLGRPEYGAGLHGGETSGGIGLLGTRKVGDEIPAWS